MLAELLPPVTEAVLGYALDKLDPADRVREWLKRDPARLAFQKALARAYAAFARQYPELTASLFDQSFLTTEAAPELAKLLTRHEHPDPARLAELWFASLSPLPSGSSPTGDPLKGTGGPGVRAASDFLLWLQSELKAEPVFQPLFDSRALESLPALEAKLDALTAELRRGFEAALQQAGRYQKTMHQSGGVSLDAGGDVTVGGDVVGRDKITDITNIYNSYFSGDFATLDEMYIRPDAVFQRVRADEFVGREWLTAKVDEFLSTRSSGAFVLVGEAGVGKTAFLAHLVRERRYLHLFAEQALGDANLKHALQSLGAQIVVRYQLEDYTRRDTLPAIAESPHFLEQLLRVAAGKLAAGEKIVVVCDALDQAGTAPNGNVFGLPGVLPEGVYLVLSRRPLSVKLHFNEFVPQEELLDPASAENRQDVTAYLAAVARRPEVSAKLGAHGYGDADFIRTLAERSGGVWMYLYYVIREIAEGDRAPLDLDKLPPGVAGYYAEYWGRWREDVEKWDALYSPLLATMAAAQESLALERLLRWAGVEEKPYTARRLLDDRWKAFLKRTDDGRYGLYHASLRDFLMGDAARLAKTSDLTDEMRERTRDAHARIVAYYGAECGGDWPRLAREGDDYARRHLCAHLAGAGQFEALFALVAEGDAWANARNEKEEGYAGYLTDLELAWRWAEGEHGWNVGRQIRCGLIQSSIYSLAGNISPELLVLLVENKLWGAAKTLEHISQMPDENQRANALEKIAPYLPEALKPIALQTVQAIKDEDNRARALIMLAKHLPLELRAGALNDALQAARAIQNEPERVGALIRLIPHLADALKVDVLHNALQATRAIRNEYDRAKALTILTPHLPDELKADALHIARTIQDERAHAHALTGLDPQLSGHPKTATLPTTRVDALTDLAAHLPNALKAYALEVSRKIRYESAQTHRLPRLASDLKSEAYAQADALIILTPHLPDELKADALQVAQAIPNEQARAEALINLAPHMPDKFKAGVLRQALQAVESIQDGYIRAAALIKLAPHLPEELKADALQDALKLSRTIKIADDWAHADAFTRLAPHLPDTLKHRALKNALRAIQAIPGVWKSKTLSRLAPHLPDALKPDALRVVQTMDESLRAHALCGLAPHLPDALKPDALRVARSIAHEQARAQALMGLAPYLSEKLKVRVLKDVLQNTQVIDSWRWVKSLGSLAPHLPNVLKAEALRAIQSITDEFLRAQALSELTPHLSDELKTDAWLAAQSVEDKEARAEALGGLAPYMPDAFKADALEDAVRIVWSIEDELIRAQVLSGLVAYLPDELKAKALKFALGIRNPLIRVDALCGLAPHLPDDLKAIALKAVQELPYEEARVKGLICLAPHLPQALKAEVINNALQDAKHVSGDREMGRADSLTLVISTYMEMGLADRVNLDWPDLLRSSARHRRATLLHDLAALAPLIEHLGGQEAIAETFWAIRDVVVRWWP